MSEKQQVGAKRFRKKPVVIEAVQLTQRNGADVEAWVGEAARSYDVGMAPGLTHHVDIDTLEGTHRADVGDWIIKGVAGEFYPCKPEIFEATYEEEWPEVTLTRTDSDYSGLAIAMPDNLGLRDSDHETCVPKHLYEQERERAEALSARIEQEQDLALAALDRAEAAEQRLGEVEAAGSKLLDALRSIGHWGPACAELERVLTPNPDTGTTGDGGVEG